MGCIRDGVPWERPSNSSIQLSRVAMRVHTQHPDSPILRPLAPPPPMPCSPGKVYLSSSSDKGVTWSRPASNALPNPNSQFSTVTIDGQVWEARQPGGADVFFLSVHGCRTDVAETSRGCSSCSCLLNPTSALPGTAPAIPGAVCVQQQHDFTRAAGAGAQRERLQELGAAGHH